MANFFSEKVKLTGKFCMIYRMILAIAILLAVGYACYYLLQHQGGRTYEKGVELVQDIRCDRDFDCGETGNA